MIAKFYAMNEKKKDQKNQDDSIFKILVVPIFIALVAGGTSPWWIDFFKEKDAENQPSASEPSGELNNDNSLAIQGSGNTVDDDSVSAQSRGDQTIIDGENNNIVQGTNNNVVQGTGNQLNIQQESEARSRGEFDIPAISGLSYHEAREILVKEGWIPFTQRHFYSQEEPSLQYGTGKIFWDLGYWEVIACSGTAEGFCRFEFSDPSGRKLVVVTAGMEDPSIPAQAMVNRVFFDEENSP
mgnify:CR=1 FL=1